MLYGLKKWKLTLAHSVSLRVRGPLSETGILVFQKTGQVKNIRARLIWQSVFDLSWPTSLSSFFIVLARVQIFSPYPRDESNPGKGFIFINYFHAMRRKRDFMSPRIIFENFIFVSKKIFLCKKNTRSIDLQKILYKALFFL